MKKKIISLFLSIALLVAACSVMAACGEEQTTEAPVTTTEATTEATTTATTTAATTTATTTAATTTATTTVATTTATTTAATTTATTEATTTEATTTVPAVTTQIALNSALDFNNGESCIALLNKATYNKDTIAVEAEEDGIVLYAKHNYNSTDNLAKADDFKVTFDLSDTTIKSGYGTYAGRPWYVTDTGSVWNGTHQYMQISFKPATIEKTTYKDASNNTQTTRLYMIIDFTFEDGKTITLNKRYDNVAVNAEGNIVMTFDLVKEFASSLTTDKMPTSTWGDVKTVKSITINPLGAGYAWSTTASFNYIPTAGDNVTVNHIVFSADYDAALNYGVDAE